MIRCFEVFCESGFAGHELQRLVDRSFPGFFCEREQCSINSPGPVLDSEDIAFLLIDPLHYDEERDTVVPGAFQELFNRDLSVIRVAHATQEEACGTREEVIKRGENRTPPQLRLVDEVCIGAVSELRKAYPTARLLSVYDTALDDKPAHASVFTSCEVHDSRKLRKLARERIHRVMTARRVPFDELRAQLR